MSIKLPTISTYLCPVCWANFLIFYFSSSLSFSSLSTSFCETPQYKHIPMKLPNTSAYLWNSPLQAPTYETPHYKHVPLSSKLSQLPDLLFQFQPIIFQSLHFFLWNSPLQAPTYETPQYKHMPMKLPTISTYLCPVCWANFLIFCFSSSLSSSSLSTSFCRM